MNIIEPLRYGAPELRAGYNRNLGYALGISIAAHLAAVGLYLVMAGTGFAGDRSGHLPTRLTPPLVIKQVDFVLEQPAAGSGSAGSAQPPGSDAPSGIGSPEVAGLPVAATLDSVDGAFASMGHVASALPVFGNDPAALLGGAGPSLGGAPFSGANAAATTPPDAALEPDEFVMVEENPKFDAAELARNVRYPEAARRNQVEGTVVVRVLIDRTGRALKTMIDHSDHTMLDAAAREAVISTAYTPAIQNRIPVAVWMQVPVVFQLR